MNKQVTALENLAQRTAQTNSDTSTMTEPHWHSISWCGMITNRGLLENGREVARRKGGWRGQEVATLVRETFTEEPSVGGYEYVLDRSGKCLCKGRGRGKHGQPMSTASLATTPTRTEGLPRLLIHFFLQNMHCTSI